MPIGSRRPTTVGEPEWSRVKDVFVRIQHFKCGYCERLMPRPREEAAREIARLTVTASLHVNCARCFEAVHGKEPGRRPRIL